MVSLRTLTIVKTDIRRFTDRVQEMRAAELDTFLREHRALVGAMVAQFHGTIVKEIGDSYLVTFESSTSALHACIALQRELSVSTSAQGPGERTEIRIAVSAGDVLLQDGDIFGTPVNTVARVEALAPPNEIYFTEAVYQNVNRNEIAADYVGTYPLKGLAEPVRVYKTTFRHQTRVLHDAALLFTDIKKFTPFAERSELADVEAVLEFWDRAQQDVAVEHGGVIRATAGDMYFLSFDDVTRAVAAWLALARRVAVFNDEEGRVFQLKFGGGLDVGDIRIFRSCVYGSSVNRAAFLSNRYLPEGSRLLMDERLVARIGEELAERWQIERVETVLDAAASARAGELSIGTIARIMAVRSPRT